MRENMLPGLWQLPKKMQESIEEQATRETIDAINEKTPIGREKLGLVQMLLALARNISQKNAKGTAIAHEVTAYNELLQSLIGDDDSTDETEDAMSFAEIINAVD
ncbi:hypothetical protein QP572_02295 [Brevibacterium sp. UMB10442]|nr:hypothetical protein [Brevibacterium sp. UMB10442]